MLTVFNYCPRFLNPQGQGLWSIIAQVSLYCTALTLTLKIYMLEKALLREAQPKKKPCKFGHCPKRGGGRNACPNCLWQFFSEYKPLLSHLIFINFTNIYLDFHQNTISESSLTLVTVKIFIPKVKIAV